MNSRLEATTALAALATVLVAAPAAALDGRLDLSVQSAYVWRGMVVNDKPVLQPSVTASEGGLSGSVWANVNLTADNGYKGEASEIDYWLAYSFAGSDVDWTFTYYAYTFPHTASVSTEEVWANVTFKHAPFSPSLSAIRDVDAVQGWYILLTGTQNLGVLRTRASDGLVLYLNVGRGNKEYCRGYLPESENESVTDYGARLEWPIRVGPGTLKLQVQYASFTDPDLHSPGFEGERVNWIGGVVYSIPF